MLGEKLLHVVPHFFGEHVAGFKPDEGRKILRHPGTRRPWRWSGRLRGLPDGRASVSFAEVQVERARRNEAGDVRCVAVLVDARDEVRETAAGWCDGCWRRWADSNCPPARAGGVPTGRPHVRGAHAVTVTPETIGLHPGRDTRIDSAPYIQNIFPAMH